MNRKGFTLIELIMVIVALSLIVGVVVVSVNSGTSKAKEKTEDIFIETLKDATSVYLNSDAKGLNFNSGAVCSVRKTLGDVSIYESNNNITFNSIINSTYKPITVNDMVNPANEKSCNSNANVRIFRDDDYVYYYLIEMNNLNCLDFNDGLILTNLPDGCNYDL